MCDSRGAAVRAIASDDGIAPAPAARPIMDCRFLQRGNKSVSQLRSHNYAPETSYEIPRGGRNTRTLRRYRTMKNIWYLEPRFFEQWDIFGTESTTVDNYYPDCRKIILHRR
ncbi:PREDICTED: uncharacterized protein LOC105147591 isoform X1 [Acromyrmex echinatior]|uniref:uncharacterized protein LOC105147591 isoform X1 n=1 Tax=Acromyrmex echinatior TaxID=103372 RepID=UPI0005810B56|nr:PREDICTED: uncharacterized protein LOC105147591 isoform X1 [Acromyrmex echinatior]